MSCKKKSLNDQNCYEQQDNGTSASGTNEPTVEAHLQQSKLIDATELANLLKCSPRHVRRLAKAEKLPQPIRLNSLVRWSREEIDRWIKRGGPACK